MELPAPGPASQDHFCLLEDPGVPVPGCLCPKGCPHALAIQGLPCCPAHRGFPAQPRASSCQQQGDPNCAGDAPRWVAKGGPLGITGL